MAIGSCCRAYLFLDLWRKWKPSAIFFLCSLSFSFSVCSLCSSLPDGVIWSQINIYRSSRGWSVHTLATDTTTLHNTYVHIIIMCKMRTTYECDKTCDGVIMPYKFRWIEQTDEHRKRMKITNCTYASSCWCGWFARQTARESERKWERGAFNTVCDCEG